MFIAQSLDGFIARKDGGIDWLPAPETREDGTPEVFGYNEFMDGIDMLVMGRGSFEKVLSFGEWPYKKPVTVLTNKGVSIPENLSQSVRSMSGDPADIVQKLAHQGFQHLYIDGGNTIQQFLRAGLIQKLIISTMPVLIGSGLPLFGELPNDIKLQDITTTSFPNGIVQSEYEIQ